MGALLGWREWPSPIKKIKLKTWPVTVDIRYHICLRHTAWWLDISVTYKVVSHPKKHFLMFKNGPRPLV